MIRAVSLSGAKAGGYDVLSGLELISEIRNSHAERLRIMVGAVAGALLRAKRAGQVVARESNVGAMLRVESHLEEVGKGAFRNQANSVNLAHEKT
jgi:hypothetical protein